METTAAARSSDAADAPLERLAAILAEAEALDARAFLASSTECIDLELVRPLSRAVADAMRALRDIADPDDDSEQAGTAFAATLELAHARQLLARETDRTGTLVGCDIARESLRRSLRAVLDGPGESASPQADSGRAAALVRALYMRLRQVVAAVDAASGRRALHTVERALADSRARAEFASVRLSDRFVLESVHRRFVELAKTGGSEGDVAELLADARAALDLFANINRRPELVQHDRRLAAWARRQLATSSATRALIVQLRELLRGRDASLDEALATASREREPDAAMLARLDAELARVEHAE